MYISQITNYFFIKEILTTDRMLLEILIHFPGSPYFAFLSLLFTLYICLYFSQLLVGKFECLQGTIRTLRTLILLSDFHRDVISTLSLLKGCRNSNQLRNCNIQGKIQYSVIQMSFSQKLLNSGGTNKMDVHTRCHTQGQTNNTAVALQDLVNFFVFLSLQRKI